jgi:hypothetical protein
MLMLRSWFRRPTTPAARWRQVWWGSGISTDGAVWRDLTAEERRRSPRPYDHGSRWLDRHGALNQARGYRPERGRYDS